MDRNNGMPEPSYITLDGLKLQYFDWGNEGRPTLLWMHGGGGHPVNWAQNVAHFRDEYRCLALTHRGHSGSEWAAPDKYGHRYLANEIALFLDAMHVGRTSIVASSSGGMVGVLLAATRPERVEKLVFTEMPPVLNDEWVDISRMLLSNIRESFESLQELIDWVRATHDPNMSEEKVRAYALTAAQECPDGKWRFKNDPAFERQEFSAGIQAAKAIALGRRPEPDYWFLITQVNCPTLIIRGSKSTMLESGTMKKMVAFMPDARGAEIDAGHVVYVDKPDEFNSMVEAFLKS